MVPAEEAFDQPGHGLGLRVNDVFDRVDIAPSYSGGFVFSWSMLAEFADSDPWKFVVQESETPDGPWKSISPEIVNTFFFAEEGPRLAPKDQTLYFRIVLNTPKGEYISHVESPYCSLSRREFLLAREIMRKEILMQEKSSGVLSFIWYKSIFGPPCKRCGDFVLGDTKDSRCPHCFGTGHVPGYYGPFPAYVAYSPMERSKGMQKPSGVDELYTINGSVIGSLRLKKDDVVVDPVSNSRFFVDTVRNLVEFRRYPVIQSVMLNEIAKTHAVYKLGCRK